MKLLAHPVLCGLRLEAVLAGTYFLFPIRLCHGSLLGIAVLYLHLPGLAFSEKVLHFTSERQHLVVAPIVMAAVWGSIFAAAGYIIRSRALRKLTFGLAVALIIAGLAWVSWRPLLRNCVIRSSANYFRQSFKPKQDMYVCMSKDAWAWQYFGGTKGLPVLQELSCNKSLAPCGRSLASNLVTHISYGRHLCSFDKYTRWATWW